VQQESATFCFNPSFRGVSPGAFNKYLLDTPSQAQNMPRVETEPAMIEDKFSRCQQAVIVELQASYFCNDSTFLAIIRDSLFQPLRKCQDQMLLRPSHRDVKHAELLGQRLVPALLADGWRVRSLMRRRPESEPAGVETIVEVPFQSAS